MLKILPYFVFNEYLNEDMDYLMPLKELRDAAGIELKTQKMSGLFASDLDVNWSVKNSDPKHDSDLFQGLLICSPEHRMHNSEKRNEFDNETNPGSTNVIKIERVSEEKEMPLLDPQCSLHEYTLKSNDQCENSTNFYYENPYSERRGYTRSSFVDMQKNSDVPSVQPQSKSCASCACGHNTFNQNQSYCTCNCRVDVGINRTSTIGSTFGKQRNQFGVCFKTYEYKNKYAVSSFVKPSNENHAVASIVKPRNENHCAPDSEVDGVYEVHNGVHEDSSKANGYSGHIHGNENSLVSLICRHTAV